MPDTQVLTSTDADSSLRYQRAALVASLAAVAVGMVFCATLLAGSGDRGGLLSHASGRTLLALGLAWLALAVGGIVPSGSAKGYLYSTRPVQRTVDHLDEERAADGYTYRHIKGPWYLFYEAW